VFRTIGNAGGSDARHPDRIVGQADELSWDQVARFDCRLGQFFAAQPALSYSG
jgi:hypothetical protein